MTLIPRSLSGRLLSVALALIVVALLAAGVAMYFALHRFVQGQVDGRLDGQILSIRDALRITPDGLLSLDPVANGPPFDRQHAGWYWKVMAPGVDLRSPSLGSDDFTIAGPPPEYHPKPITLDGIGPGDEPLRVRAQRFRFQDRSVVITASAPRHALEGPLREAMIPVALTLGVLALALIGGVLLQVRLGLRPLSQLTEDLHRVRTGRAERIPGAQPSEVAPLVAELNTLLDQNALNLERARRHVANLAHGLKTPLATLAVIMDEGGWYADGRLRPLVMTMDRRIRHHLSRARVAALGGPSAHEHFSPPESPIISAHSENSTPTKTSPTKSASRRRLHSPAKRRISTSCSATYSTTPANGRDSALLSPQTESGPWSR